MEVIRRWCPDALPLQHLSTLPLFRFVAGIAVTRSCIANPMTCSMIACTFAL